MNDRAGPLLSSRLRADDSGSSLRLGGSPDNNSTAADPLSLRDQAWASAFVLVVSTTIMTAIWFGSTVVLGAINQWELGVGDEKRHLVDGVCGFGCCSVFIVGIMSILWALTWGFMHLVVNISYGLFPATFLGMAVAFAIAAVCAFTATGDMLAGDMTGFLGPMLAGYIIGLLVWTLNVFVKTQSQTRTVFVKVVAEAVKSMPWTFRNLLLARTVGVFWTLICSTAIAGSICTSRVVTEPYSYETGFEWRSLLQICIVVWFWIFSREWVNQIIRIMEVPGAGATSVASLWFPSAGGRLSRPIHGSMGSLCRAAVVERMLESDAFFCFQRCRERRQPLVAYDPLDDAYDLDYASCLTLIHDRDLRLSEASRRVEKLFRENGVTSVASIFIQGTRFCCSPLALGIVFCYGAAVILLLRVVAMTFGPLSDGLIAADLLGVCIVAFCLGGSFLCGLITMLQSSLKAVFIYFVKDSEALATTHNRQIYHELSQAWRELKVEYPDIRVKLDEFRDSVLSA